MSTETLTMIPMLETEPKRRKSSVTYLPPMVEFPMPMRPVGNMWAVYKFEKANPFPRVGHAATISAGADGDVCVFGGFANGERSNDLYAIDAPPDSGKPSKERNGY
jgi:Galactose oxidase, central domain